MGARRQRGLCGVAFTLFATVPVALWSHARVAAALHAPTYCPIALPKLLRPTPDGLVALTRLDGCVRSGATVD